MILINKHKETVKELFNSKAASWNDKYSSVLINRKFAFETILREFSTTHKTLIDVGCATGNLLRMALGLGFKVTGIDISPEMVKNCNVQLSDCKEGVTVFCGSLEEKINELDKYDAVLCSSVFEYVGDPELYLKLFHDILNNNGIVLITIPNTKSMIRMVEKLLKIAANFFPFIKYVHPKLCTYIKYLNLSKNRFSAKEFEQKALKFKLLVENGIYINKKTITQQNNFLESNLILYVLKKMY